MDRNLALEVIRVTEAAALSCARLVGRGDREGADRAAVEAMRKALQSIRISGTVVIGEGERDEAPMLFIGEKVGSGEADAPKVDIAVDPLEGTNLCATGSPDAIAVIAIAEDGKFLNAPDTYMDKIAVGPVARGAIDITRSPTENLRRIADAKGCYVEDLMAIILERPRHEKLIQEVRKAGARIRLIGDGDVSAAIATCRAETGIDVLFGIGGAPEGVLSAAAMRCIGGEIQGVLRPRNDLEKERMRAMGIRDFDKVYRADELAAGQVMFAATGVTDGAFLRGVRYFPGGAITSSVIMRSKTGTVRYVESHHHFDRKPSYG
ncbi:MAG: class II fructose-bisphosphatase [Myxococcota bacterium]